MNTDTDYNRKRLQTEPWGTPEVTGSGSNLKDLMGYGLHYLNNDE